MTYESPDELAVEVAPDGEVIVAGLRGLPAEWVDPWRIRVHAENGRALSLVWAPLTYSDGYDTGLDLAALVHDRRFNGERAEPPLAVRKVEAAILAANGGPMYEFPDGDTVQGWCDAARVRELLDLLQTPLPSPTTTPKGTTAP